MAATYVGLPNVVITEPSDTAIQAGIATWLTDRTTDGRMRSRLVFAFTDTAKLTTPLLPADTGQLQGVHWSGMGKRSTILQWSSTQPLLSARGQLRNFTFKNFTVQSTVPDAAGFYLLSSATASNQDGLFEHVEWAGPWNYGIGLNGPATANLNSELVLDRVALTNDASFTAAWFWCGMTASHPQEDQFLNYSLRNTKLEGSHGTYLRFDRGGCIRVDGFNSWLHTGQSNNATPAGTMIRFGTGPHADSTCMFTAAGVRAELRSPESVLIDSGWGGNGHIAWWGLDTTADTFKVGNIPEATYRGAAYVSYRDSGLGGWHHITGIAPQRIIYDNCHSKPGNAFTPTPLTGAGQVRYDTKAAPAMTIR